VELRNGVGYLGQAVGYRVVEKDLCSAIGVAAVQVGGGRKCDAHPVGANLGPDGVSTRSGRVADLREDVRRRVVEKDLFVEIGVAAGNISVRIKSDASTVGINRWTGSVSLRRVRDLREAVRSRVVEKDLIVEIGVVASRVIA
jgi:hypothetical protein